MFQDLHVSSERSKLAQDQRRSRLGLKKNLFSCSLPWLDSLAIDLTWLDLTSTQH